MEEKTKQLGARQGVFYKAPLGRKEGANEDLVQQEPQLENQTIDLQVALSPSDFQTFRHQDQPRCGPLSEERH